MLLSSLEFCLFLFLDFLPIVVFWLPGRRVFLEAGLYSCGLKRDRFIGLDRQQLQSQDPRPGVILAEMRGACFSLVRPA